MSSSSSSSSSSSDDPLPRLGCRTTGQIFRQASYTFVSLFPTFFFLSLLLFSFRTVVENGTVFVTSFIERDPSLKSLLSRLDITGKNPQSSDSLSGHNFATARHHRRRPFLHLTRAGALDDDFFFGDDDDDRSVFGSYRKARVNATFANLESILDRGIRVSEVVKNGVSFRIEGFPAEDTVGNWAEKNLTAGVGGPERDSEDDGILGFKLLMSGLELGHRDAAALFFLVSVLSAAYGWVILGFVITYSWVLGVVFVGVANDLLGRYCSLVGAVWSGSRLGLRRLSGFILMRWAVRDVLTQILGLCFFAEIEDQYSFFKLFLRLKLMPFTIASPWIGDYQKEISGFLLSWFIMDVLVAFIFAVGSWVTLVSARRSGREIVREGCYFLTLMLHQAIQIKCLEAILSGSAVRWVLTRLFGRSFAVLFQALVEVYFMVAWLIFYFSSRYKDANSNGRRFGRRELEALVEGLR